MKTIRRRVQVVEDGTPFPGLVPQVGFYGSEEAVDFVLPAFVWSLAISQ